jgi:hypothetical protein
MYAKASWHIEGLRWIASLLNGAAEALERRDPEPLARSNQCPSEACDAARARIPYY